MATQIRRAKVVGGNGIKIKISIKKQGHESRCCLNDLNYIFHSIFFAASRQSMVAPY